MNKKILPLLILWLGIFTIWLFFRYFLQTSDEISEFISKPLIFILPILLYLFFRNQLSLSRLGLRKAPFKTILIWGFGIGVVIMAENIFIDITRGKIINPQFFLPTVLVGNLLISAATAFSEEIMYRGFLMQQFTKLTKNIYTANFISSLLFCITHVPLGLFVLRLTVYDLAIYLLLILLLGGIDGYIFQKTNTVYAPIITHALWNFSSTLFI